LLLTVALAAVLAVGCASTTSTTAATKTLNDASAGTYSGIGVGLCQGINESMGGWAETGDLSGGVSGLNAKSAGVKAADVTGPDSDGYYRVVESTKEVTILGTVEYSADIYIKLVTNEAGKYEHVYVYGTYSYSVTTSSGSVSYTMTFGSGKSDPYHGTATWSGADLVSIAATGPLSFGISVSSGTESHTVAMAFTIDSFSIPVTSEEDYPTGKFTLSVTYDGATQPTMTVTFDGDATAVFAYGDYTTTISVPGA